MSRQAASLRRAQEQVSALEESRARERELLLRDLHGGIGGLATNMALLADMAKGSNSPQRMQETLGSIAQLSREAVTELRGFMQSLDDNEADWHTFAADLRHWGGNFVAGHGIELHLQTDFDPGAPLPERTLLLNLFRIYREALANVVKHARAKVVRVSLRVMPDELGLAISDDGVGIGMGETEAHLSGWPRDGQYAQAGEGDGRGSHADLGCAGHVDAPVAPLCRCCECQIGEGGHRSDTDGRLAKWPLRRKEPAIDPFRSGRWPEAAGTDRWNSR